MTEEKKEIAESEPKEETIEIVGGESGIVTKESSIITSKQQLENLAFVAENIEKYVEHQKKILETVLKFAEPGDWVTFNNETAEIGFAGANRIRSPLGISFVNFKMKKIIGKDKLGDYYRYECEADCIWRGCKMTVFNRYGSRDKFFGKAYGEWKQLEEIDEGDIMIAARRGVIKEGVKIQLGLHHMPIEKLQKAGVNIVPGKGYDFTKKPKETTESPEGKDSDNLITTKQTKYVHVIRNKKKITEDQMHNYLEFEFHVKHLDQLPRNKVNPLIEWMEKFEHGK